MTRSTRLRWGLAVALLGYGLWLFWPMLQPSAATTDGDWLRFTIQRGLASRTLWRYGEFPLRTPQLGGGVPTMGHPHDVALHPALLLSLLLGPIQGLKWEALLGWGACVWGGWQLARELELGPAGRATVVAGLAGAVWIPQHLYGGDIPEQQYLLMPLLLALLLRARQARWALLAGSLLLASIALVGAYRVVLMALLAGVFIALERGWERGWKEELGRYLLLCGSAVLLALPRLAAIVPSLLESRRWGSVWRQEFMSGGQQLALLLWPPTAAEELAHRDTFHLGPLLFFLALLGLVRWRRARAPAALMGLAMWLSAGSTAWLDLSAVVARLPVLGTMTGYAKQASWFVVLGGTLLAGLGADWLEARWPRHRRWLWGLLGAGLVCHLLWTGLAGRAVLRSAFSERLVVARSGAEALEALRGGGLAVPARPASRFQMLGLDTLIQEHEQYIEIRSPREHAQSLYWILAGYGHTGWWDSYFLPGEAVPAFVLDDGAQEVRPVPAYRGEVFLESGAMCFDLVHWSPHRIEVELSCENAERLVVNQRFERWWRTDRRTHPWRGLLSVLVPRGARRVVLRYRMWPFLLGWLGTALGYAVLAWWALRGPTSSPSGPTRRVPQAGTRGLTDGGPIARGAGR